MTNAQSKNENINEEIIKYLDNEGDCERCGCNMCEEDWEHDTRELFVSNTDGKNICRRCVREEDEAEDEEEGYCWKHEEAILPCEGCVNGVKCDDWEEDEEKDEAKRNEFINTMNNGTEEEIVALVKKVSAADGLSDDALAEKIAFTLEAAKKQKEFWAKMAAFEAEIKK
jgi:hypothetical protein